MARKRMIDPGFWMDEKLGMCEPLARLLFAGLISQADDEGRLPGRPALLRSLIFPYDETITSDMVQGWLEQLMERNLIVVYTVDNQTYIQVRNFLKHQTIKKPQPSKYPAPPVHPESDQKGNSVGNQFGTGSEPVAPKRKEEKRKEEKRKEEKRKEDEDNVPTRASETESSSSSSLPLDPKLGEVYQRFEAEGFGMLSDYVKQEIADLYDEYGDVWVLEAMREAVVQNKRRIAFVRGVLQNWRSEGGIRRSKGGVTDGANTRARAAPVGTSPKSAAEWLKQQAAGSAT